MSIEFLRPKRTRILLAILVVAVVGLLISGYFWFTSFRAIPPSTPITKLNAPLIQPELITTGLKSPTGILATHDPTDRRLFVLEQDGIIRIIDASGSLSETPFLDVSTQVLSGGEMGLLGLAFHPAYKQNGSFYINYIDKNQNTVIARYTVSENSNMADPATKKVVFTLKQPYSNHNGGDLVFGPDGYLYAALGDGGGAGDPDKRAQDKSDYLGKLLRIDVDGSSPYTIPPTNPFIHESDAKPEIWAYGLRNPWRISFDKDTGDLYIADVGQGGLEEINIQKASSKGGENYGWSCYEGKQVYELAGCNDSSRYVTPALEYNHEEGRCSITGGYVYRGLRYPALTGKYFYGDYCSGQLFYTNNNDDDTWANVLAAETTYSISAFGQDSNGELYFADFENGGIYRIRDAAN